MSLLPQTTNQTQTMSSREIAELTGKDHKNVMRDIRDIFVDLGIDPLSFERTYLDSLNREQPKYVLDQELTYCLLTGYSAKLRMKVIKRWHELETKTTALPSNFADALQLAADTQRQLQLQAPKVALATAMFKQNKETGLREFVKAHQLPEKRFIAQLVKEAILYRDTSSKTLTPYASHRHHFVNKNEMINGLVVWRCYITPAGAEWLIENEYHEFDK